MSILKRYIHYIYSLRFVNKKKKKCFYYLLSNFPICKWISHLFYEIVNRATNIICVKQNEIKD